MNSCRKSEGGSPKCALGLQCRSVEVRGKSLASIIKSRRNKIPYSGFDIKKDYDLFIVLSNPGISDDYKDSIGFDPSYRKLIEFITSVGFSPEKVFCSYITRCNPPKGRKPSIQELKACVPYLYRDLGNTTPKVIMLLGTLPLRLFNLHNRGGINKIRGQLFNLPLPGEKKEYTIIPSVDPGIFAYSTDSRLEQRVTDDYRKAFSIAMGNTPPEKKFSPSYKLMDTLPVAKEFIEKVEEKKYFVFDTESRSLPWSREPLICISFSLGKNDNYVFPWYKHDPTGSDWKLRVWDRAVAMKIALMLKPIFEDPEIGVGGWNCCKYDNLVLRKHLGINTKGFIFDGMLLHHLLTENPPHDLEYCADVELAVGNYSKELHDIIGVGKTLRKTMDNVPDDILWFYAAGDAECSYRLIDIYLRRIKQKPHLWKLYCEEVEPLIHSLADAEWHGYPIDKKILKELQTEYTKESEKQLEILQDQTWSGFNPNSPNHVIKALQQAGFTNDLRDASKATGFSANKTTLLNIKEKGSKIADDILKFRRLTKISGTYLNDVENNLDNDGRVRYSFLIHGTTSGRCSNRFYHQAPRVDERRKKEGKKNIRDMLISLPGYSIVGLDFSQIEWRMLAVLSRDKEMLRLFAEGADIHKETAATLLDIPQDRIVYHNRQFGKNFGFSQIFGGEGFRIIQTNTWMDEKGIEHPLTWDILNRGIRSYRERFPGIANYLEMVPDIARSQRGTFVTPFGRERRMGDKLNDKREAIRKAAEREIVNFSIQSPAAAVMIRTINIVDGWIKNWRKKGLDPEELWLLNTVHDSGYWHIRNNLVNFFTDNLKKAAERPIPQLHNYSFPCALGVGHSWAAAEEKEE